MMAIKAFLDPSPITPPIKSSSINKKKMIFNQIKMMSDTFFAMYTPKAKKQKLYK